MTGLQASLLDDASEVTVGRLGETVARRPLTDGAWVDLRRGWIGGADTLFERLQHNVEWHAERRPMYDRVVDVPRLLHFVDEHEPLPDASLVEAKRALDAHYAAELGERFATAGLCLYRDGRDSVTWHGDRIGRGNTHDTMVAIIVLGAARPLMLRPRPGVATGGATIRLDLGHGDLVVMGGSCQRTWEHAVPKSAKANGARISVQFRPRGVR
ncbi:alpha-ketoglutarate-dependent dioxygenase AlkB [uncultured Jatrophihabitans sp.]|uniref:alpha-ketoglutarate-dependent dioxygenase AlkB n=1 Tax=uncultured Jatrophihabitans sp. TaxID=1610747 RepID=UPI0035C9B678